MGTGGDDLGNDMRNAPATQILLCCDLISGRYMPVMC